ncbi:hypothetical protein P3T76_010733 [Phytophthora citrophthora]|uniref:Uncharacterized protein n=1 Tax=Phytophthora citrophthora TaxID=4793 RepID=A0AAD9GBJ7_9STRA|nr:hypothetical protein P3T76_010733 [Phytophthora citrophthora]
MSLLTRLAEVNDNDKNSGLSSFASAFGVVIPPSSAQVNNIDTYLATTLSDLAVRARLTLAEFVRCIRGQTDADGRPNKALYEVPIQHNTSRRRSYELWNRIVREGVRPKWTQSKPQTQQYRPKNYKSSSAHAAAVRRHVRKSQLEGRYLVLDDRVFEMWPEEFISPVGVVEKGADDTRMINDYSYPHGAAVNNFTDRDNFPLTILHVTLHDAFTTCVWLCLT